MLKWSKAFSITSIQKNTVANRHRFFAAKLDRLSPNQVYICKRRIVIFIHIALPPLQKHAKKYYLFFVSLTSMTTGCSFASAAGLGLAGPCSDLGRKGNGKAFIGRALVWCTSTIHNIQNNKGWQEQKQSTWILQSKRNPLNWEIKNKFSMFRLERFYGSTKAESLLWEQHSC